MPRMAAEDYTLSKIDDCLIIRMNADNLLGIVEVNRIGSKFEALLKDPLKKVVLDLTPVRYAGSAALGMLVAFSKSLRANGGRLILCGTHHLDTLFRVSRTVAVFEIAPDVNAALKMLQQ